MTPFDAIVMGGGPAGSTCALLLARAGWSVALVERKRFPRAKVCGEYLSATNWALLQSLGVLDPLFALAGPDIRDVGLFAGPRQFSAPLPAMTSGPLPWGRAVAREDLDLLLLSAAERQGVAVRQPWCCRDLRTTPEGYACRVDASNSGEADELSAPVVVAAHGSWECGTLPTQDSRHAFRAGDLLGFKAHFRQTKLPRGLMPLVSFSGGYGGMVHCAADRVSFSCCIRRDRLEVLSRGPQHTAGNAVFDYVLSSCPVLRGVMDGATLEGGWLAAGPIRPGVRPRYRDGVFVIGNAAGEAHPVVAEGISMAMQSAWLLARRLIAAQTDLHNPAARQAVGRDYARAWRSAFAPRIHASAVVAQWAMRPSAVAATLPVVRYCPGVLSLGARLSGKATQVVPATRLARP